MNKSRLVPNPNGAHNLVGKGEPLIQIITKIQVQLLTMGSAVKGLRGFTSELSIEGKCS